MKKTKISIVTATFNEEQNIEKISNDISIEMQKLDVDYEHIIIDNNSTDQTQNIIRQICKKNKNVKAIFNSRNFGHTRSPYYAILQSSGDATILLAADFQDPIELIPDLIKKWQLGSKVVFLQRKSSKENLIIETSKLIFYKFINIISEVNLIEKTTGSGIFDKSIISELKTIEDPDPYFRGIISEINANIDIIEFDQPRRLYGNSKNNLYTLFDLGVNAVIKHSKIPLRIMTIGGFVLSIILIIVAIFFFIYKIIYWDKFQLGLAPIILGVFFGFSVLIFMLGTIGEYIGVILKQVRKIPLVFEKERINFD
jgi:glycosyltransferase involved in cell wall biosynthesis